MMNEKIDVDFIKWMVGYAEGFEYKYNACSKWIEYNLKYSKIDELFIKWDFYPLLLQRAIEGVNKEARFEPCKYVINISYTSVQVYDWSMDKYIVTTMLDYNNDDQSKELALLYIYDQEKPNVSG